MEGPGGVRTGGGSTRVGTRAALLGLGPGSSSGGVRRSQGRGNSKILNKTHKTCAQRIPASRGSSIQGCCTQRSCREPKVGLETWGSPAAAASARGGGGDLDFHMFFTSPFWGASPGRTATSQAAIPRPCSYLHITPPDTAARGRGTNSSGTSL